MEKYIAIDLMYRDGCNFKEHTTWYYSNQHHLPITDIVEKFKPLLNEPMMVQNIGIPSIAPVDNEFFLSPNDYDHSYCEITDVYEEELQQHPYDFQGDILEVISNISDGDSQIIAEHDRQVEAIDELEAHVTRLKKTLRTDVNLIKKNLKN